LINLPVISSTTGFGHVTLATPPLSVSQLAGGAVMAVGIWTLVEKSDYISLLSSKTYAASAYILVLAGIIVMVTGVLGCCATFREQRKLLLVVRGGKPGKPIRG